MPRRLNTSMKVSIAMLLCLVPHLAFAQYPKTITLTVTKISRIPKDTPNCDGCATVTTVEAHTAAANFVMTCESTLFVDHPENNLVCSQFETGVYQARMLSPEVISFWPDNSPGTEGARRVLYSVRVEEARAKS